MSLQMSFFVGRSPALVFDYLSDADKFVSVHPVISKAEKQGESYIMYETLRFAGIPITFTYPATIISDFSAGKVYMNATVARLVKIRIKFHVCAERDGCRITEDILFSSLLPVQFVMKSIFRKQHALLFEKLGRI